VQFAVFAGGCATPQATPPQVTVSQVFTPQAASPTFPGFAVVTVQPGDTLTSLASHYLNDPSMDWLITDFNEISTISPGQLLIIPLKPYARGGLTLKGYQIVPVLSYHKFSETKADKMTVTAAAFEEQMKLLKEKGYRVITMDQMFDFLDFKGQIPQKSVIITIDDGWRSAYDIAFPILKKYGYPATLFVYTDLITGSKKTLDWDLIREMSNNGIDIECHTKTHRDLTAPEGKESFKEYFEAVDREFSESSRIIRDKIHKDVKYLAYPYGATNHMVVALLKRYGYRGALTVKRGGSAFFISNYMVNRSMIYGDMDLSRFEKNLAFSSNEALK
jgi:peptidoglycan/xylan/chitin deacetylase (PgdA/CDA1 family)